MSALELLRDIPIDRDCTAVEARAALAAFAHALEGDADPSVLDTALEHTARPQFLSVLESADRLRWTSLVLHAIRTREHTLEDLVRWRADEHPERSLFVERRAEEEAHWSYTAIRRRARAFAATLWELPTPPGRPPRVILWCANGVDGACADLACLMHDVFVVPLSVHLPNDEFAWIADRLDVDAVICDTDDRARRLLTIRRSTRRRFTVFSLEPGHSVDSGDALLLSEEPSTAVVDEVLGRRPRLGLDEPCTAMFTSGSTGRPKGVVFTPFNLISKRYCRGAALPDVGRDETLLCYLPLFHTFGRYLEMLGTIYWRGTYVFAGNPSVEALLAALPEVRPTGLISIPQRWQQIRESFEERNELGEVGTLAEVTGPSLRWGLSAAGYLDPRTFRFFHRHGVALCSGFGMTEATGGITMNPPDDYVEDTVGQPLPGIDVELDDSGEMLIRGAYVARYLREEGQDLELEPLEEGGWLRTGDVFRRLGRGHLRIVDRVKDIYKNSRGQTVAPRRVEDQFNDVAGIRRVFLVGDHRPWNALLVVPDFDDPIMRDAPDEHSRHEYVGHVVAAANQRLAPFERVVGFALIERDFSEAHEELTPKGSYRRKRITENFADTIEALYRSPFVTRRVGDLEVRMPHWLLRDLGVLEDDIVVSDTALVDRRRGVALTLRVQENGALRVGDLAYRLKGEVLDLGRMSRQPALWLGNPQLLEFLPGKDGWDVPSEGFEESIQLPADHTAREGFVPRPAAKDVDVLLARANELVQTVLHADPATALQTLATIAERLGHFDLRLDTVVRRRLTALARHAHEGLRCEAYRVLLFDEPTARYNEAFGPFISSGKTFLDHDSIKRIASANFGSRRLESLRQRLSTYRENDAWPASDIARGQFLDVLRLLSDFARHEAEFYHPVRCELASWAVHDADPALANRASLMLDDLVRDFESTLQDRLSDVPGPTRTQVVFDEDVGRAARRRQWELLASPAFLVQSIQLAFNEPRFDPREIDEQGLWIGSAGPKGVEDGFFQWSIRTRDGRHYQLLVIARRDLGAASVIETNYRMLAIGGHPFGERVLPRFGCARPELGAMSLEYVDDLSVEDQIRRAVGAARSGGELPTTLDWRRVYVRGMGAVIRVWRNSGYRLVPQIARPNNVVVPAVDFREGARVLSLAGWSHPGTSTDLLVALWTGFYPRVIAQHPECKPWIEPMWIVDALVEALGPERARTVVDTALAGELPNGLRDALQAGLGSRRIEAHVPLAVELAIDRFRRWRTVNPAATMDAQTDQIDALVRLYQLERFGERTRALLFRHTCFADLTGADAAAFDALLRALERRPGVSVTQRVELSELLAHLDDDHRRALGRLVFPSRRTEETVDVITFGEPGHERVAVRTRITDRSGQSYVLREPIGAEEVGQVYRLFYREHFARAASEGDRFLVVLDDDERVVAALIHRNESAEVTHVDGVAVRSSLQGRGLASALLEDFCARAAGRGHGVVKTSFVLREFCEKRGFRADRRWGGLVRFLEARNAADVD